MKQTRVVLLIGMGAMVALALLVGCKGPIGPAGTSEGWIGYAC